MCVYVCVCVVGEGIAPLSERRDEAMSHKGHSVELAESGISGAHGSPGLLRDRC